MTSLPWTPSRSAAARPDVEQPVVERRGRARRRRAIGLARIEPETRRADARRAPPGSPRPRRRTRPASRPRDRSRRGRSRGTGRCGSPAPRRPSVSSRSRVAPTSRIDFTPAHTTSTPVRDSVVRSADSSKVSCAPRWTPPSPPVAKTVMPGPGGEVCGRGDGRRAHAAAGRDGGQLADADLDRVLVVGEPVERRVVEPDPGLAVDDGDGRRHGTAVADRLLELPRQPRVVGTRQAVADDRALERDHRAARRPARRGPRRAPARPSPSWCLAVSCSRAGRTHVVPARVPHPAGRPGRASRRRTPRPPPWRPGRCRRR